MTYKAPIPMPMGIDVNDKWLYKAAGIAAYAISLIFIIEIGLGVYLGKLPGSSGLAWLSYVNAKNGAWSALIAVTVISDLLSFLVYLSLYTALRPVSRGLILAGTILACFGSLLDEVTANANFASLLTLGHQYAAAGTAAQRAADVAAADYATAMLGSWLESIFAFAIPAVAFMLIGIVMLRSPFGKRIAYVAIAAGVFDLISASGWGLATLLNTVLQAIFFVLVGRSLYFRYAAPAPVVPTEQLSENPLGV
jgi:hypothetical protein